MNDNTSRMTSPQVRGSWVQTERATHEKWAALVRTKPRAAALLHVLVANMNTRGAVVASHGTLASLSGSSVSTVKRAVKELVEGQWIQTMRVGSERGGALAYVVNRRVAWADKRENQRFAVFDARVIVSEGDQTEKLEGPELQQIPRLGLGDEQLPSGDGMDPPSQPDFEGLEPDLPSLSEHKE